MPAETADEFTRDGWFKTGDLGIIGENDALAITGRKKDIIVTSGGKNIAPSRIECLMSNSIYISQFCVVGDNYNYLSAVVTLDEINIAAYAKEKEIAYTEVSELHTHPEVRALIEAEVAEQNKDLPSFETIKKVMIVPEFTVQNKMLTPTFKLKKRAILDHYREQIEASYQ